MLAIKTPEIALKISACILQLFFKLVEQNLNLEEPQDFKKIFNFCFETVRGLLIYAKEGKFDEMFTREGIPTQLAILLKFCFVEHSDLLLMWLETTVAGKVIRNEDKLLDLLNYAIGTIKCFTQTSRIVQEETAACRVIPILSLTIDKILKMKVPP